MGWSVKNVKKGLGFGQKNRDWVKFCIQRIVLGVSKRKISKVFPCEGFYSCVFNEMFIEVPQFHENFPSKSSQSNLKIWYVLFWSYYGPGCFNKNRSIKGHPQDALCPIGSLENKILSSVISSRVISWLTECFLWTSLVHQKDV